MQREQGVGELLAEERFFADEAPIDSPFEEKLPRKLKGARQVGPGVLEKWYGHQHLESTHGSNCGNCAKDALREEDEDADHW